MKVKRCISQRQTPTSPRGMVPPLLTAGSRVMVIYCSDVGLNPSALGDSCSGSLPWPLAIYDIGQGRDYTRFQRQWCRGCWVSRGLPLHQSFGATPNRTSGQRGLGKFSGFASFAGCGLTLRCHKPWICFCWMCAGRLDGCLWVGRGVGGQAEQTRDGREAEVGDSESLFVVPGWGPLHLWTCCRRGWCWRVVFARSLVPRVGLT